MYHKFLPAALVLACALIIPVAVAATPVSNDQAASASTILIRTSLQHDLTLKNSLSTGLLRSTAFHQKTCHCSCGFPCNQDDDCGPGGVCEQFISCCERGPSGRSLLNLSSTRLGKAQPIASDAKCK